MPPPTDVEVGDAPYLNGLAETVGGSATCSACCGPGTCHGRLALFAAMEEIALLAADLDYPDAITGNLRRSTDVARSIIERTRSDLTLTVINDLADALRRSAPGGADRRPPGPRQPGAPRRLHQADRAAVRGGLR